MNSDRFILSLLQSKVFQVGSELALKNRTVFLKSQNNSASSQSNQTLSCSWYCHLESYEFNSSPPSSEPWTQPFHSPGWAQVLSAIPWVSLPQSCLVLCTQGLKQQKVSVLTWPPGVKLREWEVSFCNWTFSQNITFFLPCRSNKFNSNIPCESGNCLLICFQNNKNPIAFVSADKCCIHGYWEGRLRGLSTWSKARLANALMLAL